jgi:hypothetical protein
VRMSHCVCNTVDIGFAFPPFFDYPVNGLQSILKDQPCPYLALVLDPCLPHAAPVIIMEGAKELHCIGRAGGVLAALREPPFDLGRGVCELHSPKHGRQCHELSDFVRSHDPMESSHQSSTAARCLYS